MSTTSLRAVWLVALTSCGGQSFEAALDSPSLDSAGADAAGTTDAAPPSSLDAPVVDGGHPEAADPPDVAAGDVGAAEADPPTDANDAADPPDAGPPDVATVTGPKMVFVTSRTYPANFGGLAAADAACMFLAGGRFPDTWTFKAWLSDETTSAADRLTHSTGPYTLVDGSTVVAQSWTDLVSGSLRHAINQTEVGAAPPSTTAMCGTDSSAAWTNTYSAGQSAGQFDCMNWTTSAMSSSLQGQVGKPTSSAYGWTNGCAPYCTASASFYCVQQ